MFKWKKREKPVYLCLYIKEIYFKCRTLFFSEYFYPSEHFKTFAQELNLNCSVGNTVLLVLSWSADSGPWVVGRVSRTHNTSQQFTFQEPLMDTCLKMDAIMEGIL